MVEGGGLVHLIVALLNNLVLITLLVFAAAQHTLLNPKGRYATGIGVAFGLATILAIINPIYLTPTLSIDTRHAILLMSGFLGGWAVAVPAWIVAALYLIASEKIGALLALIHLLSYPMLGVFLHYIPERTLKRPAFAVSYTLLLPGSFIAAMSLLLPSTVLWAAEPLAYVIIFIAQLITYFSMLGYFALRQAHWRRSLLNSILQSGSTHLFVFSTQCRLLVSTQPAGECNAVINAVKQLLCAGDQPLLEQIVKHGLPQASTITTEENGRPRVHHASFAPVELPSGETVIKVILDDISESGQSLAQLERFFSMSADGMAIIDARGRINVANEKLASILGYSIQEFTSINTKDLMDEESYAQTQKEIVAMLKTGRSVNHFAGTFYAKDGSSRTLSWSAAPALTKGLFYVVARDITDHKRYELAMAELAAIVQQAEYAIVSLTTSGRVLTWNSAAQRMWQLSIENTYGAEFAEYVDKVQHALLQDILLAVANQGVTQRADLRFLRSDGTTGDLIATFSPLRTHDGVINGISVIASDVTNQRAIEKELARLARLELAGQMATGIGHELRNPMTTIRGFLQLFTTKDDFAEYRSSFELIISELDRCNSIISEFLSLAKNRVVVFQLEQLNEVVQALGPLIRADAALVGVEVQIELGDVPKVLIDSKEIRQLILNLTRNAMEAMATTKGLLKIVTEYVDESVILRVIDWGTGIPPEIAERIGTPFLTTKDTGTGLGLAVCYSIVSNHNAKLDFASSPQGTTFSVHFPCPN